MKRREIETTGTVDQSGRLKMYMGELNAFLAQHKGERILARFTAVPVGTSEALTGYYFKYIVPTIRAALVEIGEWKTEQATEQWLRQQCPICVVERETNGTYIPDYLTVPEMGNAAMVEYVEWIKEFAAENLNVFIDEPETL